MRTRTYHLLRFPCWLHFLQVITGEITFEVYCDFARPLLHAAHADTVRVASGIEYAWIAYLSGEWVCSKFWCMLSRTVRELLPTLELDTNNRLETLWGKLRNGYARYMLSCNVMELMRELTGIPLPGPEYAHSRDVSFSANLILNVMNILESEQRRGDNYKAENMLHRINIHDARAIAMGSYVKAIAGRTETYRVGIDSEVC